MLKSSSPTIPDVFHCLSWALSSDARISSSTSNGTNAPLAAASAASFLDACFFASLDFTTLNITFNLSVSTTASPSPSPPPVVESSITLASFSAPWGFLSSAVKVDESPEVSSSSACFITFAIAFILSAFLRRSPRSALFSDAESAAALVASAAAMAVASPDSCATRRAAAASSFALVAAASISAFLSTICLSSVA